MDQKVNSNLYFSIFPISLLLLVIFSLLGLSCQPSLAETVSVASAVKDQPNKSALTNVIVTEMDTLSESAEDIFTLAQSGKMGRTRKKLDNLKKSVAAFDAIQDDESLILLQRLGHTIEDLEKAVISKERLETMLYSNRITVIAATIAVPFKPSIPTELSLLDYNGRELGIWSEAKQTDKLSSIVIRMHLAWQTLMPKLIEHSGIKELKRFSELMGHLELAKTPEEYGRLSRQVLVETDAMRPIFAKQSKGAKSASSIQLSESSVVLKPMPRKQGGTEVAEPSPRR